MDKISPICGLYKYATLRFCGFYKKPKIFVFLRFSVNVALFHLLFFFYEFQHSISNVNVHSGESEAGRDGRFAAANRHALRQSEKHGLRRANDAMSVGEKSYLSE